MKQRSLFTRYLQTSTPIRRTIKPHWGPFLRPSRSRKLALIPYVSLPQHIQAPGAGCIFFLHDYFTTAVLTSQESTKEAGRPLGFDDGAGLGIDGVGLAKEGKAPNSSTSIAVWRRCARSNLRPVWLRPRLPSSDFSSVTCQQGTIRQETRRGSIAKTRRYAQQEVILLSVRSTYLVRGWPVLSQGCVRGPHHLEKGRWFEGSFLVVRGGVVWSIKTSRAGRQAGRPGGYT